jgi:hypothetical protein
MTNRTCTILRPAGTGPLEAVRPISINGKAYPYEYGKPLELPEDVIEVAREAGLEVAIHEDSPVGSGSADESDAAAGSGAPGGENPGGSDTFDADAIITGTVPEVEERLEGLTLEQLELVAKAEIDREQPRVGVREAIARAKSAFTGE